LAFRKDTHPTLAELFYYFVVGNGFAYHNWLVLVTFSVPFITNAISLYGESQEKSLKRGSSLEEVRGCAKRNQNLVVT
jgi:hypothetical protein